MVQPFNQNITICFSADSALQYLNPCLAYVGPEGWVCQSRAVFQNGLFCGQTNHFTDFSLIITGNPEVEPTTDGSEDEIIRELEEQAENLSVAPIP